MNKSKVPTFKVFESAEHYVELITKERFKPWYKSFEHAINVLVELSQSEKSCPQDVESPESYFFIITEHDYQQAPQSFRSCMLLMERGLYHDATIVARALLESIVKRKYFINHQDRILDFERGGGRNISIKKMWDEVAGSDSYSIYKMFCKFTHKNYGTSTPWMVGEHSDEKILLLPLFNPKLAGFLINTLNATMYAYLNLAPLFFNYNNLAEDFEFNKKYSEVIAFFARQVEKNKKGFPESIRFNTMVEKIISTI